jgi:hypothetical protein
MRSTAEFINAVQEAEGTISVMDYMQLLEVPSECRELQAEGMNQNKL